MKRKSELMDAVVDVTSTGMEVGCFESREVMA
jgi:hypothetical protein